MSGNVPVSLALDQQAEIVRLKAEVKRLRAIIGKAATIECDECGRVPTELEKLAKLHGLP